jgi:hypothetical protein
VPGLLLASACLVDAAPDPGLTACVVIPARDEAATIGAAIAALAAQETRAGVPADSSAFEVVVLANNCTDDTAERAREAGRRFPGLALHVVERRFAAAEAHVGAARRAVMDEAARRLFAVGRPRGVIASTDADTQVAPDWLEAIAGEVAAGADAVAGRILFRDLNELPAPTRRFHLLDTACRLLLAELETLVDPDPADPWPRHHQHFGANFAVTAGTYRRAGGTPAVPVLEDVALVDALRRIDARIRHSPRAAVRTSARRSGRVAVGLAGQLGEWEQMARDGAAPLAGEPQAIEARLRARRRLRAAWRALRAEGAIDGFAEAALLLGPGSPWTATNLAAMADFAPSFGCCWERVEGGLPTFPLVLADVALADLRHRVARLRAAGRASSALEHVQPVRLFAGAVEPDQGTVGPSFGQERLVDLVAGERVVVDEGRPVHEHQMATR